MAADGRFTALVIYVILYVVKEDVCLRLCSDGRLLLGNGEQARRVCSVGEAAKQLRRSRRQIYRYLADGSLEAPLKVLGEWLIDYASVERLAARPLTVQPVPARMQPLFPEYEISDLNVGRDQVLILARVLGRGGLEDLRWALKRYGRRVLRKFIVAEAARTLDARSLTLWSLVFEAEPVPAPGWRRDSNPWARTNE